MMTAKLGDKWLYAMRTYDRSLDYRCPVCGESVILKAGQIKVSHFAHKTLGICRHGTGESEEHRMIKSKIYDLFSNKGYTVQVERRIGDRIADIAVKEMKTVFEVQLSNILADNIKRRTWDYLKYRWNTDWLLRGDTSGDYIEKNNMLALFIWNDLRTKKPLPKGTKWGIVTCEKEKVVIQRVTITDLAPGRNYWPLHISQSTVL